MTTQTALIGVILDTFALSHTFLRASVADVPEGRMTEQPGTLVNHPAWTLSHLNAYRALLLAMLGEAGAASADAEMAQFGYGTTPVTDPGAYLPKAALLARFDERQAQVASAVAQRHGAYFSKQPPEPYRRHSPTIGHLAVIWMTTHEGHHLGQLRQWRRAAGMA